MSMQFPWWSGREQRQPKMANRRDLIEVNGRLPFVFLAKLLGSLQEIDGLGEVFRELAPVPAIGELRERGEAIGDCQERDLHGFSISESAHFLFSEICC